MKYKLGERVVVYDSRLKGSRQVAVVSHLNDPNGFLKNALCVSGVVRWDGYDELIVSQKQVRKIKK